MWHKRHRERHKHLPFAPTSGTLAMMESWERICRRKLLWLDTWMILQLLSRPGTVMGYNENWEKVLATHKTEMLLINAPRIPLHVDINIENEIIRTKSSLKYLGIRLYSWLTFPDQIQYSASKVQNIVGKLSRLMAIIWSPLPAKRRLLMEVIGVKFGQKSLMIKNEHTHLHRYKERLHCASRWLIGLCPLQPYLWYQV